MSQELTSPSLFFTMVFTDKPIILKQLFSYRQQIKRFDFASGLSDTVTEEYIEFQAMSAAEFYKRGNIQRLKKGYHRVRRVHPQRKSLYTRSLIRVDNNWFHNLLLFPQKSAD